MTEPGDRIIEDIAQLLRDEPMRRPAPSFDARVMAAIRWQQPEHGWRSRLGWLLRPRSVMVSPLGALGYAAVVGAVAYLGAGAAVRDGVREVSAPLASAEVAADAAQPTAAIDASELQLVQFLLVAPDARSVSVVGDFNDWNARATPMGSVSGNVWTVQVPLAPGRYKYVFMVDGETVVADPAAPLAPRDDLGQPNSVVTVGNSAL